MRVFLQRPANKAENAFRWFAVNAADLIPVLQNRIFAVILNRYYGAARYTI